MKTDEQRKAIDAFRKHHGITLEQLGQYMRKIHSDQALSRQHVDQMLKNNGTTKFETYKDQFAPAFNAIFKERGFEVNLTLCDIFRMVENRQKKEVMQVNV